jgi:hypothetical protein
VQVEDEEAEQDHLRRHVEAAAAAEKPELPVPQGPGHVLGLDSVARHLPQDCVTDDGSSSAEPPEEEEGGLDAPGLDEQRERERADNAPDRDRRLPDPEREATLARGKPLHESAAARGLDAGADAAGRRQNETGADRRVDRRHHSEERAAPAEADRERAAFADAVGEQAPREQPNRQPHPLRREQDPDALKPELVLLAQRRCDGREAERDRREARLRGRAGAQDGPAVAARGYRPNGLNGFGDVETSTLFVSR